MFYSHPYLVPVLDAVADELWFRQLGIGSPQLLSGDAGVLLDHLTEHGLNQLADFHWIETHGKIGDRWFHWLIEDLVEEIWEYPLVVAHTGGAVWQVRDEIQRTLSESNYSYLETASLDRLSRMIPTVPDPNYRQRLLILLSVGHLLQYQTLPGLGTQMMTYGYQYRRWLLYPILDKLLSP